MNRSDDLHPAIRPWNDEQHWQLFPALLPERSRARASFLPNESTFGSRFPSFAKPESRSSAIRFAQCRLHPLLLSTFFDSIAILPAHYLPDPTLYSIGLEFHNGAPQRGSIRRAARPTVPQFLL